MTASTKKNLILLFYPPLAAGERIREGEHVHIPISVMVLASVLREAGFDCEMLDLRDPAVFEGWEDRIRPKLDRVIAAGLSCTFTGQVPEALMTARALREMAPDLPLVWGGWHPWLLDEETTQSPYVDIVARGMGELNAVALFQALRDDTDLSKVPGLTYLDEAGTLQKTETPSFPRELPRYNLPYDELDLSKYEMAKGRVSFLSSRGCPQRCSYCQIFTGFNRRWVARETPAVLDEMEMLVNKYGITHFAFLESNFFTNRKRVRQICEGIVERGLKITWEMNGHVTVLAKGEPDLYALMKQAGCVYIASGIESGSQRILDSLWKDYTPEEIREALRRIAEADIPFNTNFIVGLPGETMEDLRDTFRLVRHISETVGTHHIKCYMYHPIPGSVLFDQEASEGQEIVYPMSLEEWGDIDADSAAEFDITKPWAFHAPYLKKYRERSKVTIATFYLWLGYLSAGIRRRAEAGGLIGLVFGAVRNSARRRLDNVRFGLPLAWWLYNLRNRLPGRAS